MSALDIIQAELTDFLVDTFGEDVWDDSPEDTARRWLKAMGEFATKDEIDFNMTVFDADVNQMIVVPNIQFESLCAHHLFPFYGMAHVAYIPSTLMVGLSKIPRLVEHYAHRPNTQEQMTRNIASHLKSAVKAMGVAVIIEGVHTCMTTRGVKARNSIMRTSEMRGVFLTAPPARAEFLELIRNGGMLT
jgi:GTP cyclohydrolase I